MIASKLRGITKWRVPILVKKAASARWDQLIGCAVFQDSHRISAPSGPFSMPKLPVTLVLSAALALLALGCGSSSDDDTASTVASAEDCTPAQLDTHAEGRLTVATDKPAFPPYFEDDEPANGKGFESAVAYAIADQLGHGKSDVEWVAEPFNSSYAPGPKDFDFDLNQISITPQREKAVDFSTPYYTAHQAVVALDDSAAADAESLEERQGAKIGVQIGTTSLEAVEDVIDPSE